MPARRASTRPDPIRSTSLTGEGGLAVRLQAFGPGPEQVRAAGEAAAQSATVRRLLGRARWRLLTTTLLEPPEEEKGRAPRKPSDRFLTTIYDYTNNRTLAVTGSLASRNRLGVEVSGAQPWPTHEEFLAAVQIVRRDPELGTAVREGLLLPYSPMPPLAGEQLPDGRFERTITVGLLPSTKQATHEIVGVNMTRRSVVRFENKAPATALAHNPICGLPPANQGWLSATPGQAWVTITQGGRLLWRFLASRPAASSGTNGSGIELKYVDYRGKRVLYQAHVPILNVKYDGDACGPYRDRQDREGMFQANGWDPVPGFRLCPTPAQTIIDTGNDVGNFQGVAVYVQGNEVVFVSEMEAGWYRYISQWRLATDGRIRARFGFSSVQSSCVCNVHNHHVYWRLDFDIRTPLNNRIREYNNPCLPGFCPSHWHTKYYEISRPRDPGRARKWRVDNTVTHEAYDLIPGSQDGVAGSLPDWPFPRGDTWMLHYHPTEIDDGSHAWGPPYEAGLNTWVNGEPLLNQDVVIWYGAHFRHDLAAEPPGTYGGWVGPDLVPVRWRRGRE